MKTFEKLEKKMGFKMENRELLHTAFVHKSYINEHKKEQIANNERLEFLGDAVLELATTIHLFKKCPEKSEGEMTSFRSALVKGKHLAQVARELELGNYLLLSHGEEKSGGREKNYILANTAEALIGAIYLEKGFEKTQEFIKKFILDKLDEIIEKGLHIDAKSRFQELSQEIENFTPYYEVLDEKGPDHEKTFIMGAYINGELIAKGKGSSKQKAEDDAANNALTKKGWE
jgi:ribonuclease III